MRKLLFVIGTRPEIIKTAPVIKAFEQDKNYSITVCLTGQHKEMAKQMIAIFGLRIDYDLRIMKPQQSLNHIAARAISRLEQVYARVKPDMAALQGDTTTAFCAALAAFYQRIKVMHIEAGLRTYDLRSPYPEELNRSLISRIADLHFAPTRQARRNLLREHIPAESIYVTGNTVVDALVYMRSRQRRPRQDIRSLPQGKKLLLVTAHRRENFGRPLEEICRALKAIAEQYPDVCIVYPMHLNPHVQQTARKLLGATGNAFLLKPVDYADFVYLMDRSFLILTDSGGIQEEAPSLHKPVLILRNETERPEVVQAGCARLVGTDKRRIIQAVGRLVRDTVLYARMGSRQNPVGDGKAAARIKKVIDAYFTRIP